MRIVYVAVLMGLLGALAGCGGGKCAGPSAGDWVGTTLDDKLTVGESCTFDYRGPVTAGLSGCRSTGTYGEPLAYRSTANRGNVAVTITSASGEPAGLCLPTGEHSCTYAASETTLGFNCGAGSFNYRR